MRGGPEKPILDQGNKKTAKQTHISFGQPTETSWINKLRIMHTMRQTRHERNIHHSKQQYVTATLEMGKQNGGDKIHLSNTSIRK